MKDLVPQRLMLAVLLNNQRKLEEYQTHFDSYSSSPLLDENQRSRVVEMLTLKYSYPANFPQYAQAWQELAPDREIASSVLRINNLMTELETMTRDALAEALVELKQLWTVWTENSKSELETLKRQFKQMAVLPLKQVRAQYQNHLTVFHAMDLERCILALSQGKIQGYTTHKYWADGRRRNDGEPDYEDSFLMKGISTTRCLDFALGWNSVVLVLNLDIIKKTKKVDQIAWNYILKGDSRNFKKEREEYVILSKQKKTYRNRENSEWVKEQEEILNLPEDCFSDAVEMKEFKDRILEKFNKINLDDMKTPEGELSLDKCLLGFFLRGSTIDIYGMDHHLIKTLMEYPKFLGILDD